MNAGQRFARLVTRAVVRKPALWALLRRPVRRQFDRLAPSWAARFGARGLPHLDPALDSIDAAPRRILDLGTGTGVAAVAVARRWPDAEVVGADLSPRMVDEARSRMPPELAGRVRFDVADAADLPYADASFDLVVLANMIPFFDELARVTAPSGRIVFGFSGGAGTPIYVPSELLRSELARRGFTDFAEFAAGSGTALVARRPLAA